MKRFIIEGQRFGKLVTVNYDVKKHKWYCKCDCGGNTYVDATPLNDGKRTACMCSKGLGKKLEAGDRFGKLVVIKWNKKRRMWNCKCDCGGNTYVSSRVLKVGRQKSCKCGRYGPDLNNRRPNNESLKLDILYIYQYCAKKSNRLFELSSNEVFKLIDENCHYCGSKPMSTNKKYLKYDKNFRYNGIDRMNNEIGYTKNNCVTCCEICNRAKLKMGYQEFLEWIKRVYDKQFNK
jgi:hypothetical protein